MKKRRDYLSLLRDVFTRKNRYTSATFVDQVMNLRRRELVTCEDIIRMVRDTVQNVEEVHIEENTIRQVFVRVKLYPHRWFHWWFVVMAERKLHMEIKQRIEEGMTLPGMKIIIAGVE